MICTSLFYNSEEELAELIEQQSQLETRVKRSEEAYRREKEALDSTIAAKSAAAAQLEQRLAAVRDPSGIEQATASAHMAAQQLQADLEVYRSVTLLLFQL
jgi:hypothetical protein